MYPYFSRKKFSNIEASEKKESENNLDLKNPLKLTEILASAIAFEEYYIGFYEGLGDIIPKEYKELIESIILDVTKSKRLLKYILDKYEYENNNYREKNSKKPDTLREYLSLAILTEASEAKFYRELMLTLDSLEDRDIIFEIMSDKLIHTNILNYIFSNNFCC